MIKRLVPAFIKKNLKHDFIYKKYRSYSMIPKKVYLKNLQLAEKIKYIEGSVVECGVWKGGMIAGIAELLKADKNYLLFDSFEGLPLAQEIDGERAIQWQQNTTGVDYFNNCKADYQEAENAMKLSGTDNYQIYPGWFEDTLKQYSGEPIALLRLDADWYSSTMLCLEYLFDHVVNQGIIIIDDYYVWDGCSKAVHDFLAQRKSTARIRMYKDTVCWIQK